MVTEQDLNTIKDAIFKNIPKSEIQTAMAIFNVTLHVLNQFERIAVAFEKIADKK